MAMNNVEIFKSLQKEIGASNSALSRALGVSVATVEKRRAGKVSISDEVILAMFYLRGKRNAT